MPVSRRPDARDYTAAKTRMNKDFLCVTTFDQNQSGYSAVITVRLAKADIEAQRREWPRRIPRLYLFKHHVHKPGNQIHAFTFGKECLDETNFMSLFRPFHEQHAFNEYMYPASEYFLDYVFRDEGVPGWCFWMGAPLIDGPDIGRLIKQYNHEQPGNSFAFPRWLILCVIQQLLEAMDFLLTPKPIVKPWTGCHGDLHLNNIVLDLARPPPTSSHAYIRGKALPCIKIIDFEMSATQDFTDAEILSYDPVSGVSMTKHFLELTVDEKDAFDDDIDKLKDMLLCMVLSNIDTNLEDLDGTEDLGLDRAYINRTLEILGSDQQDVGNALEVCRRWLHHEGYQKLPSDLDVHEMRNVCRRAMDPRPTEQDMRMVMEQYLVDTPEEEDDQNNEVGAFSRIIRGV